MKTTKLCVAAAMLFATSFPVLAAEVDQRQADQQARIDQGVDSGQLTKSEAKNVEGEHKAIGKEIKADRAANGGKLTAKEKRQINRQQNKESKKIYRKKHNAKVRPNTPAAAPAAAAPAGK
jgi:hypothetical protein